MFKNLKNWLWFKFIIKGDEFDSSLDLSHIKMIKMNKKEREEYILDIVKKRNLAHELDMKNI